GRVHQPPGPDQHRLGPRGEPDGEEQQGCTRIDAGLHRRWNLRQGRARLIRRSAERVWFSRPPGDGRRLARADTAVPPRACPGRVRDNGCPPVCLLGTNPSQRNDTMAAQSTVTMGLFVRLVAKEGKERAVEDFLRSGLEIVQAEPGTIQWYAVRFDRRTFAI